MIVNYRKENKEFIANFEDSDGYKVIFGPYPSKEKMYLGISEYFKGEIFEIKSKDPDNLIINGIDYDEMLDEVLVKIKTRFAVIEMTHLLYLTHGVLVKNTILPIRKIEIV